MCWPRSACCRRKPKTLAINVDGELRPGVTAKDLVLAIIGKIGVDGGTGHVIEFRGPAIRALYMDERMTVCNMSIEAGARAGMVAPDETTFDYLQGPAARAAGRRMGCGRGRLAHAGHRRRRSVRSRSDASMRPTVEPMVTWGTHPGMVAAVTGSVPTRQR